jgi:hypothetical protein
MIWRASLRLVNRLFVEALIAQAAVEAFDKAILHRFAGCDVVPFHTVLLPPSQNSI